MVIRSRQSKQLSVVQFSVRLSRVHASENDDHLSWLVSPATSESQRAVDCARPPNEDHPGRLSATSLVVRAPAAAGCKPFGTGRSTFLPRDLPRGGAETERALEEEGWENIRNNWGKLRHVTIRLCQRTVSCSRQSLLSSELQLVYPSHASIDPVFNDPLNSRRCPHIITNTLNFWQ